MNKRSNENGTQFNSMMENIGKVQSNVRATLMWDMMSPLQKAASGEGHRRAHASHRGAALPSSQLCALQLLGMAER